jgi:hypothetical protein
MQPRNHRAIAINEQGLTFQFTFKALNWNGISEVAEKALAKIVANDTVHQQNGPWTISSIDVGG